MCVELAVATGIAPSVWAEEGEQAIATAFDLLNSKKTAGEPQMSG